MLNTVLLLEKGVIVIVLMILIWQQRLLVS